MDILTPTSRPIKYYGHGLLRNRKFAEAFLGRKLTPGGQFTEIHHYLPEYTEKVISKPKLSTIPGIGEAAQMPLCAVVRTGDMNDYAKVLGLHLTEDEYRMVQALNFDGLVFEDTFTGEKDHSPRIPLLKEEYRELAAKNNHKDGTRAHVYDLLGINEEQMIAMGRQLGDEIAMKLGIQRTTIEGKHHDAPEGDHGHRRRK